MYNEEMLAELTNQIILVYRLKRIHIFPSYYDLQAQVNDEDRLLV